MSTELSRQSAIESLGGIRPDQIIEAVKAASDAESINDVRARVAAAKAWAKVHKRTKDARLDLLKIEVAALKRLGEIEAFDMLTSSEAAAARWLASATDDEVSEAISNAGAVTTASAVVTSAKGFEKIRARFDAGYAWASRPSSGEGFAGMTDDEVERRNDVSVTSILNEIVEEFTEASVPFTVEEVTDAVINASNVGSFAASDAAFRDGVRRVCRQALRGSVPTKIGGTPVPRFITCHVDGDEGPMVVRVPTVGATLPLLDDMIQIREAQVADDVEAIRRLRDVRSRLESRLGGRPREKTTIGDLMVTSARPSGEAA